MAKVLRCPACGAGEAHLYAHQDAVMTYSVRAALSAPDGIATSQESYSGDKYSWRMGCGECGEEDEPGTEPFGGRWLVEEHDDGDDQ